MMLKLQRYQFTVQYKKGKELYIADTLSRAPVTDQPISTDKQECEVFRVEMAEMEFEPNQVTPDTLQRIRRETAKDTVLAALHTMIMNGWPSERKEVPEQLRLYWNFRDEISVYDGRARNNFRRVSGHDDRPNSF